MACCVVIVAVNIAAATDLELMIEPFRVTHVSFNPPSLRSYDFPSKLCLLNLRKHKYRNYNSSSVLSTYTMVGEYSTLRTALWVKFIYEFIRLLAFE